MKALLIDTRAGDYSFLKAENIEVWKPNPIEDSFSESEFSFDSYCHKYIVEGKIQKDSPDTVILPYSITDSLLEFTGLQIAHHIRLSENLGDSRFIPIVFIGMESPYVVSRLTPYSNILYCEGSYWSFPKRDSLKKLLSGDTELSGLSKTNYSEFLNRIDVRAPSNYESHHGVDNEFCLLNWSKYVACDEVVDKLIASVGASLYFKFIRAENPFEVDVDPRQFLSNTLGKVYVIDDEGSKGWYAFYKKLFQAGTVEVDALDMRFKDSSRGDIVTKAIEGVKKFDADIVLLDLRLCDEDFKSGCKEDELTGLKILEDIKKFNRGIQVIITSASDKASNYRKAIKLGALDYLLKNWRIEPKQQVGRIRTSVEDAASRARLLKPIWSSTEVCTSHLDKQRRAKLVDKDLEKLLNSYLFWAFDALGAVDSEVGMDIAFHYYFLILEACAKVVIDEDSPKKTNAGEFEFQFRSDYTYLQTFNEKTGNSLNKTLRSQNRRIPYNQKFFNLIYYVSGSSVNSKSIIDLRNDIQHPNVISNRNVKRVEGADVKEIFKVVHQLITSL